MSFLFSREGGEWRPDGGAKAKVIRFADLPSGWHFGQGGPIALSTVDRAVAILNLGEVLGVESNAFPGAGGEVAVAFYGPSRVFEVVVGPDGIETAFSEPYGEGEVERLEVSTPEEVYSELLDMVERPEWHSLDSSTHYISTSSYHVSPILHSSIPDQVKTATRR